MKIFKPSQAACLGASTKSVRTTEHMEECRACKTRVRFDLVDHRFWGFKASCPCDEARAVRKEMK